MLRIVHCYPFNCTTFIISTGVHDTLPNHVVWIQAVLNLQTPDWRKPKIKPAAAVPGCRLLTLPEVLLILPERLSCCEKKIFSRIWREEGWKQWKQDQLGKAHKAGAYPPESSVDIWWMNKWISTFHSCSLSLITLPWNNSSNPMTCVFLGLLIHGAGANAGNWYPETDSCDQQAVHLAVHRTEPKPRPTLKDLFPKVLAESTWSTERKDKT